LLALPNFQWLVFITHNEATIMALTKVSYSIIQGAPVNVLDFGADATGVNDSTAAIQAALNASSNVYLPIGTYRIQTTLSIPGVYQETRIIRGAGFGYTNLEWYGSTSGTMFTTASRSGVIVDGIKFKNQVATGSTACLAAGPGGWEYSSIRNNMIEGFNVGIAMGTNAADDSFFNTIAENLFVDCGYGILVQGTTSGLLPSNANWVNRNKFQNCGYGINWIGNFTTNDFSFNDFEGGATNGIYLEGNDSTIINCYFELTTGNSINIASGLYNYIINPSHAGTSGTLVDNGARTTIFSQRSNYFQWGDQRRWSLQNVAYAATLTPDARLGDNIYIGSLTGNLTLNLPTNAYPGQVITFFFFQDATGNRRVTYSGANWRVRPDTIDLQAFHWSSVTFQTDGTWWEQVSNAKEGNYNIQSIPYAATITPDLSLGTYITIGALTNNLTLNEPTNVSAGTQFTIFFTQDGTGGRTVTYNGANWRVRSDTIETTAFYWSTVTFIYDNGFFQQIANAKQN
jgi:hypothetical protein